MIIPSRQEIEGHAKVRARSRKLTMGSVSLSQAKGQPATIASVSVDISDVSDATPATIHLVASGAKMPIGFINNPLGARCSRGWATPSSKGR